MKTMFKGLTIFALLSMFACKVRGARAQMMFSARHPHPHLGFSPRHFGSDSRTF